MDDRFLKQNALQQQENSIQFIPVRGSEQTILNLEKQDGYIYFTTDTGKIYMDTATQEKILMGGSSGIFYGNYIHNGIPAPEQEDFEFSLNDLEDPTRAPNPDDLILNIPDGSFYRVISVESNDEGTIIFVKRLTLTGSGGSGGGTGTSGKAKVTWHTPLNVTAIFEKQFNIEFDAYGYDPEGNPTEGHVLVIKADRMESGKPTTVVRTVTIDQGFNSIDISQYLKEVGTWRVAFELSMEIAGTAPIVYYRYFTVAVTTVSLTWDYDEATLNNIANDFTIKDIKFIGSGDRKQLKVKIGQGTIQLDPIDITGNSVNYSFSPIDLGISHGVYDIEIYGEIEINGEIISTESVYKNAIFYEAGNKTTLISCSLFNTDLIQYTTYNIPIVIYSPNNTAEGAAKIVLIENSDIKAEWTNRKNGVTYNWLYTPTIAGENIPLTIQCDNQETNIIVNIRNLNIDNKEVEGYSFRFKTSEMADEEAIRNWAAAGNATFSENFDWVNCKIASEIDSQGYAKQYFLIKNGNYVTMNTKLFSESASENGLSFKIIYKAINCRDYDAQFLNCYEEQKVLRANTSETIDLEIPEGSSFNYSGKVNIVNDAPVLDSTYGGTISEYSSTNIGILDTLNNKFFEFDGQIYYFFYRLDANNNNEIVITINPTNIVDSGIGIKMRAQDTEFSCNSSSITIPYYEESYIELEFDIAKNQKTQGFKGRYIKPWLDGVPCGIALYDNSDLIQQNRDINVVIGSPDCDVCLYLFKVYNRSLSDEEHLANFIADAPNAQEMFDRYTRNDILNKEQSEQFGVPIIDYAKLSDKNPECKIHLYSLERMTRNKKDPVGVYSYSQYKGGQKILGVTEPLDGIVEGPRAQDMTEAERNKCPAQVKVQGTSSAAYGLAAYNMDTNFTHVNSNNEEVSSFIGIGDEQKRVSEDGWSMDDEAIPCTFFCTKVNVASAEGANNALNQEWYNYHQPYVSPVRAQTRADGKKYRDTMQFQPGVVFIKDWNQKINDSIGINNNVFKEIDGYTEAPFYKMYSIGCMGNSKDNTHVFHTENECCVENGDNQLPGQWMTICPGAYEATINGVKSTYYVDLDSLEGSTYCPAIDAEKDNMSLWEAALDDVYGFRYPDGIDEAKEHPKGQEMIQGWFNFVHWISRLDPLPRYEVKEINNLNEFNEYKNSLYYINQLPDDDLEYLLAEEYNEDTTYYQETVHVHGPTGKKLDAPYEATSYTFKGDQYSANLKGVTVSDYAKVYTHDTTEYRMAKFLNECEDHLVMDSIVYHYLFIERHTMIDNVAKNTFWSSADYIHWDLTKNYDNDTADGNDNQGKLTLTYGYEIGDKKNDVSVFNASNSVWLNLINKLPSVCKSLYQTLDIKSSPWNADSYLNEFTKWQSSIPERCWIEDYYRKYIRPWEIYNDGGFLPRMEGGKKTHQREQYERYQFDYLGSKYQINLGSQIEMRPNTPGEVTVNLTLEVYADGYINIALGKGATTPNYSIRAKRNTPYILTVTADLKDATFYIFGPKNIQAIGNENIPGDSLAIFRTTTFGGGSDAIKLRKLVMSTINDGAYVNNQLSAGSFQLGSMQMLEDLYACYLTFNNSFTSLDLSGCPNIKHVDGYGSNFSIVTIPDGAPLEYLRLSDPQGLIMSNLLNFKDYIAGSSLINQLKLNNIDNNSVNSKNIVLNALPYDKLTNYNLTNVKWVLDDENEMDNNSIAILDNLIAIYQKYPRSETFLQNVTGSLFINKSVYDSSDSIGIYEKYCNKNVYPNLDIQFESENAKLCSVNVVDGNDTVIWTRKIKKGNSIDDPSLFFTEDPDGFIPPYGTLDLNAIQKMNTNTTTYERTNVWEIYDTNNNLIQDNVGSDINGYPAGINIINTDIVCKLKFEEKTRYYSVTFYDDNDEIIKSYSGEEDGIEYNKVYLKDLILQLPTIPYRDDSNLSLKATWNFIGYNIKKDLKNTLPENYKIISDIKLYPVFQQVDDITKLTPHYEYFNFEPTEYSEKYGKYEEYGEEDYQLYPRYEYTKTQQPSYEGWSLTPRIALKGKVVLPIEYTDENGITKPIVKISNFSSTRQNQIPLGADITHIFFENKKLQDNYIEIAASCFVNLNNLQYFDFHDSIGKIGNSAFQNTNLQHSLYGGLIHLSKNLISIGSSAFQQAFNDASIKPGIEMATPYTLVFPPRLNYIGTYGFIVNPGLAGYEVIIGSSNEYSNLELGKVTDTNENEYNNSLLKICNNDDSNFSKVIFITENKQGLNVYTNDNKKEYPVKDSFSFYGNQVVTDLGYENYLTIKNSLED